MVRFHAALGMTWKREARPRVSARDAYPRRLKHNTVDEGGIADGPSLPIRTRSVTRSDRRQPQDHVAEALDGAAQGGEIVDPAFLQPDQALTLGVDLRLDRTASTTLRNSMMLPSPVRLTMRP
jgi:hypothetical protein